MYVGIKDVSFLRGDQRKVTKTINYIAKPKYDHEFRRKPKLYRSFLVHEFNLQAFSALARITFYILAKYDNQLIILFYHIRLKKIIIDYRQSCRVLIASLRCFFLFGTRKQI